ncbi:MAG: hypothetical protein A2W05_04800 [Candidatus Schekmanbacteria bacterium RBG_16_38_10]|uniref:Glycosyl transferase family 1 domain-containing protein n=1 Tax=Candidatus Schekmanbacteria bacterium RBG_16_38_10 TaxID=1817879 RepID=A0A1F7RR97_9BACT|nr:MAG: hypothetical protein A2W05_04800 [Candidatus Schekmanbacteria bacterium RBG_16_38_10]
MNMNGHFNLKDNLEDVLKLVAILKKQNIDIVHSHRGHDHWLAAVALAISRKKTPLIRTRHVNVAVRNHIFNKWLYNYKTDKIICVAKHIKDMLISNNGFKEEKLELIYTGADTELFDSRLTGEKIRRKFGISDNSPVVGVVGRITPIKGHRFIIDAIPAIKNEFPDAKFIFAGDFRDRNYLTILQSMSEKLGIKNSIIFTGFRDDIPYIVASFDVAVISSKGSEGSSRACYEFMAMKKPIVATKVGIIPEIIEDGITGMLVPRMDSEAMASAIINTLKKGDEAKRMGEAAYRSLMEKFNFNVWVDKNEKLFFELLSKYK